MVITEIQKTKKGRYALFVDGEFLFSVHGDTYALSRLAPGLATDAHALEELRLADEARSCKDKALSLLAHAPHSRGMLLEKLRRFYDAGAAESTADRMEELGLLDDLDYGRRLAADLVALRGWSLRRVEQELYRRRLDRETAAQVMEDLATADEEGDSARILRVIRKRYYDKIWDQRGLANTIGALRRQGFSQSDIREALAVIEEEEENHVQP